MKIELIIQNGDRVYIPILEEGIEWTTERMGTPGQLKFKVLKDDIIDFTEGNAVAVSLDGEKFFYGFIFTKKRDKGNIIAVTVYDQLRYLKNKDTYAYENKTADELIKTLASKHTLQTGTIEGTGYKIDSMVEENTTLIDMIYNALDLTMQNKKEIYVLYDDVGKLTLRNISSMWLNLIIDEETGENLDYTSSIDSNTYNRIKLFYENDKTGKREWCSAPIDGKTTIEQEQWGILQYCETIQKPTSKAKAQAHADALLQLYNNKTRNLSIQNAIGDIRVRGGCLLTVQLNIGDVILSNRMIVEKVKHTFKESEHFMNLTLRGGDFIA